MGCVTPVTAKRPYYGINLILYQAAFSTVPLASIQQSRPALLQDHIASLAESSLIHTMRTEEESQILPRPQVLGVT